MKYWAFISYSHTDKKWGDWLHKALETYRIPRRLIGKESRDGRIPERLFPIFRDREELPVSADLSSNINEALRESRYLIVICSPRAAQSRWVSEEIKTFKRLGREDRILALITDGEPNAAHGKKGVAVESECFPQPMRYRVDQDGHLSSERTEPIAADARENKDGRHNAKLKLLAGLLGLNYDELRQRDQERRLRRARAIGAASLLLVGIFAALAAAAMISANKAATQKRETQRLLVASDSTRAEELFDKGEGASALGFLARATQIDPEKQSVPAQRLWFALTQRSWPIPISSVLRHDDSISSACFSPDGNKVLTASADTTARIWDANSGAAIGVALHHQRTVRRAIFTPDGQFVLTICADATARLWDAKTGLPLPKWIINHPNAINAVAVSPNGHWVATGSSDGTLRITDLTSGQSVTETREAENVHTLAFHPTDETLLLSISGRTAKVWKLPENRALFKFEHVAQINSAEFSPKGDRILTASDDRTLRLWDVSTGTEIGHGLQHEGEIKHAAFSPDGSLVASVMGARVLLWNVRGAPLLKYAFDHNETVTCVRFNPDNLVLFSGTSGGRVEAHITASGERVGESIQEDGAIVGIDLDRQGKRLLISTGNGSARVWQAQVRYPISDRFTHKGGLESLSISPDGHWLLTASDDGNARLWDLAAINTPPRLLPHKAAVLSAAFSPDSQHVLTGSADATARLWITSSGDPLGVPLGHATTVNKVAFSPDGSSFATASDTGQAQFWDAASRQPLGQPMIHGSSITGIDFSPDGKLFLTAGRNGHVQLFRTRTGQPAGAPLRCEKEVTCARFSPKANLLAAGARDGTTNIWAVASDKPVQHFTKNKGITDLAFSPDGRYLATASEDHTATIWEISTGRVIGDPLRHSDFVDAVVFSPDSREIATASEDGTVRVWDVLTGRAITEMLRHQKAVRCLAFSGNGRRLFSGSRDRTVRSWDVASSIRPKDREGLAKFARAISPARLNESGRIDLHPVDPGEILQKETKVASGSTRTLLAWFFGDVARRPLTPYSSESLADYIGQLRQENSDAAREEAFFLAPPSP